MERNWYIICTKPRRERKVAQSLTELRFPHYCPLNRKVQQWKKRQETIHKPLFGSYVFVQAMEQQLGRIGSLPDVVHIVKWSQKPAVVPEDEIVAMQQFLKTHYNVLFTSTHLKSPKSAKMAEAYLVDREGVQIPANAPLQLLNLPTLGMLLYARQTKKRSNRAGQKVGSMHK
ncbi:hypothetical protein GU926_15895 [Nibribacter ruber]|uniref:NusG-like N-terminal domain-containing protein n=1 Tax=Nibribacter ruber TaxID=2698458 RepID=A0A6P1P343_9BACT|nr:transcription termination/antitermination NusG family protein [Nibribacter ruber]QHL88827.1 hypothetical protein GU926_15895 [Nibribacter ruber]